MRPYKLQTTSRQALRRVVLYMYIIYCLDTKIQDKHRVLHEVKCEVARAVGLYRRVSTDQDRCHVVSFDCHSRWGRAQAESRTTICYQGRVP